MIDLPTSARVVIIGGGISGCSVAYHLTELGWTDVVLLERKQLTSGTTWHAAGLVGQLQASQNRTRLAKYSADLYGRLEAETGLATGFRQCGSITVALSAERREEILRLAAMARAFDVEVNELSPAEVAAMYPRLNVEGVVAGVHLPADGQADPANVALALAKGARARGARIVEQVKVTAVTSANGRVTGVDWEAGEANGHIAADLVVNCGGMWGRDLAARNGVTLPLHACEHFYIVTEPIPGLERLPVLRVPEECAYYKEDAGKILLGAFEPVAKPWGMEGIREDFCFDQLPEDFDHFEPILEKAIHRMPMLAEAGIHTFFNGPESFTPDDRYYLGEAPELAGYWVAAGYNSIGIASAGGAGMALARWMDDGEPPFDLWEVDIRRAQPFQRNRRYLRERVTETLGLLYADHFPYRQMASARGVRRSPLHAHLAARGAVFGEAAGWERANWFAAPGEAREYRYTWGRPNWFANQRAEHMALREGVGLIDMSSFGKIRVEGRDALTFLQRLCANEIDVEAGRIVYTQMLNARGGIESDLTVNAPLRDGLPPRRSGRDTSTRPELAPPPPRRSGGGCHRHLGRRGRDPGHGTALARPSRLASRRTISPTPPTRSARRARSRSASVSPAPTALPMSVSLAGSSTSPRIRRRMSSRRSWRRARTSGSSSAVFTRWTAAGSRRPTATSAMTSPTRITCSKRGSDLP